MTPRPEGPGLGLPPPVVEVVSGLTAGALSTLCCHPLDLIKIRLQIDRSTGRAKLGASYRVFRSVITAAGARGLYRGLAPNAIGNMTSWGLYFLLYSQFKSAVAEHHELSYPDFFLTSGSAGLLAATLTNPIWVIKTRMLSTNAAEDGAYRGFRDGVKTILQNEGPKGLMRGLVPAMFGVSHGAMQFMFYEELKKWRMGTSAYAAERGRLHWLDYVMLSGCSKVVAGTVTYPYKVVQARMQSYNTAGYKGPVDVVKRVLREEGVRGFYKGLAPSLARLLPATCITFAVYENCRIYLL